jgi:hypothetical protein
MDYLIETEPTVSDFLDLDGKPVSLDGFKLDHDEEMIPYELSETSLSNETTADIKKMHVYYSNIDT